MRSLAFAALALPLLFARPAPAQGCDGTSLDLCPRAVSSARWAPRHDTRLARYAITTRDGAVTLLLTPFVVAYQLSDDKMRRIERKLRDEQLEADGGLAAAFKTAVLAGVRVLLKHSAECPVRELRDVDYRDGRLVFVTQSGRRVFDRLEVNDGELAAAFAEPDARAFVREFRRIKAAVQ